MSALLHLFAVFFQIGLLSIGGGYAIIPLMQEQVVVKYGFLTPQTFTDIITISQMTPGPLAVNTSTFVGIRIAGIPGALAATIGCIAAGVCISLLLYGLFQKYRASTYALDVLRGMKSASVGLILSAAAVLLALCLWPSGTPQLLSTLDWNAVVVIVCSVFVLRKWKLNPMILMLLTGVLGLFLYGPVHIF